MMAAREVNTYVPAHQIRLRNSGDYLFVKWWSGKDTNYAHFHRPTPSSPFQLHSIGRNGTTIAEKDDASLSDLHEGIRETLHARYNIADYGGGGK